MFGLLDAFRGVAALCVMLYHFAPFPRSQVLGSAYLAVDLFFVLSGFVIAYAYDGRFRQGLSVGGFLRLRLTRLYPVYFAGSLLGVVFVVMRNLVEPEKSLAWGTLLVGAMRAALFLPDTGRHAGMTGLFPFDMAAWSLSLEIGVNCLYALSFRALTTRVLAVVVACSAAMLVASATSYGSMDMGATAASLAGGVERCAFGFSAGVLLFRLRGRPVRLPRVAGVLLLAVVLATFALPTEPGAGRIVHDLVCVLLAMPLLVWLGSWARDVPAPQFFGWLAAVSYPVYVLHTPVLWSLEWATLHVLHRHAGELQPVSGLVYAATTLVIADLAVRYYEAPLRRLGRWRLNRAECVPLSG